jgi:hypothetical protein
MATGQAIPEQVLIAFDEDDILPFLQDPQYSLCLLIRPDNEWGHLSFALLDPSFKGTVQRKFNSVL